MKPLRSQTSCLVRAIRSSLDSLGAIGFDLLYLTIFSIVAMSAATMLFRRTL
jgi:hypothetical protein